LLKANDLAGLNDRLRKAIVLFGAWNLDLARVTTEGHHRYALPAIAHAEESSMTGFHIGIDLDNTIIDYDDAFVKVGIEVGLLRQELGLQTKEEVKAFLITPARGEEDWMRLQGQVYGRYIDTARLRDGVAEFLRVMREHGARLSIISHKTRYGHFDAAQVNLWDAARRWLEHHGFFAAAGFGLDPKDLHFLETRDAKIAMIAKIGCHAFVDDLPSVLLHPSFPEQTLGFWLAGKETAGAGGRLTPYPNWIEIHKALERLVLAGQLR